MVIYHSVLVLDRTCSRTCPFDLGIEVSHFRPKSRFELPRQITGLWTHWIPNHFPTTIHRRSIPCSIAEGFSDLILDSSNREHHPVNLTVAIRDDIFLLKGEHFTCNVFTISTHFSPLVSWLLRRIVGVVVILVSGHWQLSTVADSDSSQTPEGSIRPVDACFWKFQNDTSWIKNKLLSWHLLTLVVK